MMMNNLTIEACKDRLENNIGLEDLQDGFLLRYIQKLEDKIDELEKKPYLSEPVIIPTVGGGGGGISSFEVVNSKEEQDYEVKARISKEVFLDPVLGMLPTPIANGFLNTHYWGLPLPPMTENKPQNIIVKSEDGYYTEDPDEVVQAEPEELATFPLTAYSAKSGCE